MKAFVLAAGLGTRLRPFTLEHPKALVPVGGVPMLRRVLDSLSSQGFCDVTVNIHHFGDQIVDYLFDCPVNGVNVSISDERAELLDTGGAILHAREYLEADALPFLVHNVDILSDADLQGLYDAHRKDGNDVTLLVSERESSRRLVFDAAGRLKGWHHVGEGRYRPEGFVPSDGDVEYAFSGIHVMSSTVFSAMERLGYSGRFSVIDFLLSACGDLKIKAFKSDNLHLIDIGKPATLSQANGLFA